MSNPYYNYSDDGAVSTESWDIKGMVNDYLKDVYFKSDEFRNMVHETARKTLSDPKNDLFYTIYDFLQDHSVADLMQIVAAAIKEEG